MTETINGPWPPTREMAKALGAKHYFTGDPCKRGHIAPRFTAKFACIECSRIAQLTDNLSDVARRRKSEQFKAYVSDPHRHAAMMARKKERDQTEEYREKNRQNARRYYERKRLEKQYEWFIARLLAGEDVYGLQSEATHA
ncbi:MAG TPA: hypothetical protein VFT69_17070 [Pseudolabrys sp.]|nr:hypothetical protein [Pseudolabrys sp.]